MSSKWFFYDNVSQRLGLECSTCGNDQVFEGLGCQDYLVWKCSQCGAYLRLNLKPLETKAT